MGTIKLKATQANPYHKTGLIVEVEEDASKHLIEKGYFTLASEEDEVGDVKDPLAEEENETEQKSKSTKSKNSKK